MLPTLQPWSMPRMEHQCDDQAACTGWVPYIEAVLNSLRVKSP